MATCRNIIKSAYRRSGILAAGVNMNSSQAEIGLELLQELYMSLIAGGMFGRFEDVYLEDATYEAKEGERIYNSDAGTVTLPTTVTDVDTGLTRAPKDGAFVAVVDPANNSVVYSIYDADYGGWQTLNGLALDTYAPLSGRYGGPLKALLALELLGDMGLEVPMPLASTAARGRMALATRRDGPRKTGVAEYS